MKLSMACAVILFVQVGLFSKLTDQTALTNQLKKYWDRILISSTDSKKWRQIKPDKANRFLGFVEGSLEVTLPKNWNECFLNMKTRRRERIQNNNSQTTTKSRGIEISLATVEHAPWTGHVELSEIEKRKEQFDAVCKDGKIRISCFGYGKGPEENGQFDVPATFFAELFDSEQEFIRITSAMQINQRVYLAANLRDEIPSSRIYCFDKMDSRLIWKSEIQDYGGEHFRGSATWFTQICPSKQGLWVFSICDTGFAIDEVSDAGKVRRVFVFFNEGSWDQSVKE